MIYHENTCGVVLEKITCPVCSRAIASSYYKAHTLEHERNIGIYMRKTKFNPSVMPDEEKTESQPSTSSAHQPLKKKTIKEEPDEELPKVVADEGRRKRTSALM